MMDQVIDIQQKEDEIMISMESAEISNDDLKDEIILSEHSTLKGILFLGNIISILINNKPCPEKLKMLADIGSILDFELSENKVRFFIEWINNPNARPDPKSLTEKILWL